MKPTNAQKWGAAVQINAYCQGCGGGPRALYAIRAGHRVITKRCGDCMERINTNKQGVFEQRHKTAKAEPTVADAAAVIEGEIVGVERKP